MVELTAKIFSNYNGGIVTAIYAASAWHHPELKGLEVGDPVILPKDFYVPETLVEERALDAYRRRNKKTKVVADDARKRRPHNSPEGLIAPQDTTRWAEHLPYVVISDTKLLDYKDWGEQEEELTFVPAQAVMPMLAKAYKGIPKNRLLYLVTLVDPEEWDVDGFVVESLDTIVDIEVEEEETPPDIPTATWY